MEKRERKEKKNEFNLVKNSIYHDLLSLSAERLESLAFQWKTWAEEAKEFFFNFEIHSRTKYNSFYFYSNLLTVTSVWNPTLNSLNLEQSNGIKIEYRWRSLQKTKYLIVSGWKLWKLTYPLIAISKKVGLCSAESNHKINQCW